MEPFAKGLMLMTNILSIVRIDKLLVPEMIESDCSSVELECVYSGAGDDVTVRWLLNGSQVYEWSAGSEPRASGILAGRVDLSPHRTSMLHSVRRRTLHLTELTPAMSGDYTCIVQSRGQEARLTKTMIVFSPEREFELTFSRTLDVLNFKCNAKHLHPQPELTIEYNKIAISQQQQRIWKFGSHYDAECTAVLSARELSASAEVACRLQIPQVDYTAITKKFINIGNNNSASLTLFSRLTSLPIIMWICVINLL